MKCILPVEVLHRDFDGRLLLSLELIKKGFDCIIGRKDIVHNYMLNNGSPYVYIAKSITDGLDYKIKSTGGVLTILDEEGGVFTRSLSNVSLRLTDETIPYLDLYFAWGSAIRDELMNCKQSLKEEQIAIVGNPRFDLCKTKFTDYHRSNFSEAKNISPGYFLINTDFAFVNNQLGRKGRIEFDKKNPFLKSHDKNTGGKHFHTERIAREEEYQEAIFNSFIEMIHVLSKKYTTKNIIIRPHPVENESTYKKIFSNTKNVHVIRSGNAQTWINNATAVIHHDCTTGIESMLMNKLTVSYCPYYDAELAQWLPVEAGYKIQNLNDLLFSIERHLSDNNDEVNYTNKYNYKLIETYIANVSLYSAGKIADIIYDKSHNWKMLCQKRINKRSKTNTNKLKPGITTNALKKLISARKQILNQKNDSNINKLKQNKFPGISTKEITKKISCLSKSINVNKSISIQKIGKDSYLLQSESR